MPRSVLRSAQCRLRGCFAEVVSGRCPEYRAPGETIRANDQAGGAVSEGTASGATRPPPRARWCNSEVIVASGVEIAARTTIDVVKRGEQLTSMQFPSCQGFRYGHGIFSYLWIRCPWLGVTELLPRITVAVLAGGRRVRPHPRDGTYRQRELVWHRKRRSHPLICGAMKKPRNHSVQ